MRRAETTGDMRRALATTTLAIVDEPRPRTRGDCVDAARPCPWFGCRYHLGLNVNEVNGTIWHALRVDSLDERTPTCALDVADSPPPERTAEETAALAREGVERSRAEVAAFLNVSVDTVESVEASAFHKLRRALTR